jgi:hypothetical protein
VELEKANSQVNYPPSQMIGRIEQCCTPKHVRKGKKTVKKAMSGHTWSSSNPSHPPPPWLPYHLPPHAHTPPPAVVAYPTMHGGFTHHGPPPPTATPPPPRQFWNDPYLLHSWAPKAQVQVVPSRPLVAPPVAPVMANDDDFDVKHLIGGLLDDFEAEEKKITPVVEPEPVVHHELKRNHVVLLQNKELKPVEHPTPFVRKVETLNFSKPREQDLPRRSLNPPQSVVKKRDVSPVVSVVVEEPPKQPLQAKALPAKLNVPVIETQSLFSVLAVDDDDEDNDSDTQVVDEEKADEDEKPAPTIVAKNTTGSNSMLGSGKPRFSNQRLWSLSKKEERKGVQLFWKGLNESEKKRITRVERHVILDWIKHVGHKKSACHCASCVRKRELIDEDVNLLFRTFYESLDSVDDRTIVSGQLDQDLMRESIVGISSQYKGTDGADLPDICAFGCLLQIEDVVAHHEIRYFLELLDRRAESRMQEESDRDTSSRASHTSGSQDTPSYRECHHYCCEHHRHQHECDDYEDEEEDEEYDDDSQCSDWDDLDLTDERVAEVACQTFELFALKSFEKKLMGAYHERMSIRKQLALLEEDAFEKASQERKKAKRAEKKRKQRQKLREKKQSADDRSQR